MHLAKAASILGFQNMFSDNQASYELHEKFAAHMEDEGLSYGTREEYEFRFELFRKTDVEINEINAKQDSWVAGHNMFSTMTEAEAKKMLGGVPTEMDTMEPTIFDESDNGVNIDWRK